MIVIIFTGGTISMRHDAGKGGTVPSLTGREILALASGVESIAPIEVDEWGTYPGPHMTPEHMWRLRQRVLEHTARADVDGVVITHGTDSMEETAYLLARSIRPGKPIVLTGAMRTSSDFGWDGPANIAAAVRVAASPGARTEGVLVAMNDRVYSGIDVAKRHTYAVDSFDGAAYGAVGVVDGASVVFERTPVLQAPIEPSRLESAVDIVLAYSGADSRHLDAARASGAGIVIAAMGRGNVPPAMVPGIERWIAEAKPVVITSRVGKGRVGATYGYAGGGRRLEDLGVIFGGNRLPQQARIDLMLALGASMPVDELRTVFCGDGTST
jgi:L-asparaginase